MRPVRWPAEMPGRLFVGVMTVHSAAEEIGVGAVFLAGTP